jgi:hypothetical protein
VTHDRTVDAVAGALKALDGDGVGAEPDDEGTRLCGQSGGGGGGGGEGGKQDGRGKSWEHGSVELRRFAHGEYGR